LPVYGVTLRTMKSRTLMEVCQSPGRKPLQQSPASASFLRAALVFMDASIAIMFVIGFAAGTRIKTRPPRLGDCYEAVGRFD
jgi:hypothetical protein